MRTSRPVAVLALASLAGAGFTPALAQDAVAATAPAPATTPTARDRTAAAPPDRTPAPKRDSTEAASVGPYGLKLSGYVETAFNHASGADGSAITGRLYERTNHQFTLNALKLSLDRPADAAKLDAGFHADMILGQNASVLQSVGFTVGPNADLYQVYGTLNVPTPNGNGLQVKVGRMATFLGVEVIETPLNPNVSIANQFIYAENFTQTGLSVEHRFSRVFDAQVRVLNGWDQVQDVNSCLSYMARLGIAPRAGTSVSVAAFTGAEQPKNNVSRRSGVELIASHHVGHVTAFVQGDIGREEANSALPDAGAEAKWWATGAWLVVDATSHVGVALRADYMNDRNAARTGGAFALVGAPQHRLASATATLNLTSVSHLLLRPELRFDRSDHPVFRARREQMSVGFSAAYLF